MQEPRRAPTPMQLKILAALAAGTNRNEIAEQLGITMNTLRTHRRDMLHRIGARDTAHAVAMAHEQGWFDGQEGPG